MNMAAARALTVGEALAAFRRENGLADDESLRVSWSCRLGPVAVRLPNFAWRRQAIFAHDLHHVLTGFPCTMRGECQMAAWEFGAGGMPHWGATCFCLPLIVAGLLWAPRRILLAFLGGRRSRSLHQAKPTNGLLAAPLSAARDEFTVAATIRAHWSDHACFALLVLRRGVVCLWPVATLAAIWLVFAGCT